MHAVTICSCVYVVLCYFSINAATSKTEELKLLRSVNAFRAYIFSQFLTVVVYLFPFENERY